MKKFLLSICIILIFSLPAWSFTLPDIKKGIALKERGRLSITPTLSVELHQWNFSDYDKKIKIGPLNFAIKDLGSWTIDWGFGTDLTFISLNYIIVEIVEISIGAFFGWDFEEKDYETGLIVEWIQW